MTDMVFRLAEMNDLPCVKRVFTDIIRHMNENDICIWDDIFPCEFFEGDINNSRLYVLTDGQEIVSACALLENCAGSDEIEWHETDCRALYLNRFGVNRNFLRRGIGARMLENMKETARRAGARYLRLFVVDINKPAIELYLKSGFEKAKGEYYQKIDDNTTLREYGFECKI